MKFFQFLFTILLFLNACAEKSPNKPDNKAAALALLASQPTNFSYSYTVTGRLTDSSSNPLANHTISLASSNSVQSLERTTITLPSAKTDTNGYYILNLNSSSYSFNVLDSSYNKVGSFSISVKDKSTKPTPTNVQGVSVNITSIGNYASKLSAGFSGIKDKRWLGSYGGITYITSQKWGASTIKEVSTTENVIYTQDTTETAYVAGFSRIRFTDPDEYNNFRFCIETYGKTTLEEAKAVSSKYEFKSDTQKTCGSFSWTILSKAADYMQADLLIKGIGTDIFGSAYKTTDEKFGDGTLQEYNNDKLVLYDQNPYNAAYFPSKYRRIRFTKPENKVFYYCFEIFDADTLSKAQDESDTTKVYTFKSETDKTCNGFIWTKVTLQ